MFRFSYFPFIVSLSLILLGGFVAFKANELNQERAGATGLTSYVTALVEQTRLMHAHSQDFTPLSAAGNRFDYQLEDRVVPIVLSGEGQGFRFRLTQVPPQACEMLRRRFSTAEIKIFEAEGEVVNWRHEAPAPVCYGSQPQPRESKKLNALELTFKR